MPTDRPTADSEMFARGRARLGSVLGGKWRLDAVLGVGGTATVFAATHCRNGARVALKVLHPEFAANPDLRERFLREAFLANSVRHPGMVRVLDDDTAEDGAIFLVMELLCGETLQSLWARRGLRLETTEVAPLVEALLGILAAVHEKGIVHRDLKPENVFLTRDRQLKLFDFGVARHGGSPTHTCAGTVLGTPNYMSPEQALGRTWDVDARSDVWSVGAIAFALLSGRVVHNGMTMQETLVSAATRRAPPLATVAEDVPAAVAQVVDRALVFEKQNRWPDARSMQDALARAWEEAPRSSATVSKRHPEEVDGISERWGGDAPPSGIRLCTARLAAPTMISRAGPVPTPAQPRISVRLVGTMHAGVAALPLAAAR